VNEDIIVIRNKLEEQLKSKSNLSEFMDEANWQYEIGVILSCNEAKELIKFIDDNLRIVIEYE